MFWIVAAAMMLIVGVFIGRPLFTTGADGESEVPAASFDLAIYREQLAGIDRDVAKGTLPADEAETMRAEIGRRLISANREMQATGAASKAEAAAWVPGLLLVGILAGAVGLYSQLGAPDQPDAPMALRLQTAEARRAALPDQARLEAAAREAGRLPTPRALTPEDQALMDQLRAAVQSRPNDLRGLDLLARQEASLGNLDAALAAQRQATALREAAGNASPEDYALEASLLLDLAGGRFSREAATALEHAKTPEGNPATPNGQYLQGLLELEVGRPDNAFRLWRELSETLPPDHPLQPAIRPALPDLAWLSGLDVYTPATPPTTRGPDQSDMAAAGQMDPEARREMIAGMVSGLEARLAEEGGTAQEWAQLITALGVQGKADHAREIAAEARAIFAGDANALSLIERAETQVAP